jgi:ATP-dependent Clp endopeptidase proteolytic subunit ClpP
MKYYLKVDDRLRLGKIEETVDLPAIVHFTGEFDEESAKKFLDDFRGAEDHAVKTKQECLPIVIDSYGGQVYSLLGMVDIIKSCKIPVATIISGKAMSCGAVLATCGTEGYRYMAPSATMMIHEVSSGAFGKVEEIKVSSKETDRLNGLILKLMAKNIGKTEHYIMDLIDQNRHADWFLDAEEAVKHNLVNKIGIPAFNVEIGMNIKFG